MEQIGNYKIIRELGTSDEAISYLAHDEANRRNVVLRKLLSPYYQDAKIRERIEARLDRLARHDKHYVAEYLGIHEIDSELYLIREYIDGISLAEYATQSNLANLTFYKTAIQLVQGLKVAHEFGVIHGRLTPNNVIITQRGDVRFTECGLSLDYDDPDQPEFIPDEINQGISPNETTDIFSLGVLLYHMLTNEFPFPVGSPPADTDMPDFSSVAAKAIDSDIRLLIEKMLSTDPAFRGAGLEVYLASLQAILESKLNKPAHEPTPEMVTSEWSGRKWLMISALSAFMILAWLVIASFV
jgi:serine/threonine protein kinase